MVTQKEHIYLNNDKKEIFLVRKILKKYAFKMDVGKPDKNNVVFCTIYGKNDNQDLSVLKEMITVVLGIIYTHEWVIEHPIT